MNINPYEMEIKHITAFVDVTDKRVLEIGCGNGRLTKKIARLSHQ